VWVLDKVFLLRSTSAVQKMNVQEKKEEEKKKKRRRKKKKKEEKRKRKRGGLLWDCEWGREGVCIEIQADDENLCHNRKQKVNQTKQQQQ